MTERRTALITGAASGIGRKTTERFSEDPKYNPIYAADKDFSVYTIFDASKHPHVIPLQVDIRKGSEIAGMFARIFTESDRLDVVVNAAGIIIAGEALTHTEYDRNPTARAQINDLYDTNYFGQMHIMIRAEIAIESRGGGTIINITSAKDYFPDPFRLEYMASKMRFEEMSIEDAKRLKYDGVRIVVVKPGNTKTNIDRGDWIDGSSETEKESVQGFNDWWRRTFGNNPKNVAEVIYKIAEGEINKDIVHVGFDAKLGNFLVRTIPGWRYIFFLGSYSVYELVKRAQSLRKKRDSF